MPHLTGSSVEDKCRQARKGQSKQCGQKICINQRSAVNWRNRSRRLVGRVMENLPEEGGQNFSIKTGNDA
ncbi:hypothetical protein T07_14410 [Trichinella nelsoni]|uniref:Uncharacterized protein n=1 Tax=Trichinella nelsoni TaxID=6336 RepID=A0A0V0S3P9_9BILA|nr:hypothetical protein T07_14410 [Trichinella nelsoni]